MCVQGRGEGGLGSSSTLLRPAVSPIVLRKKYPLRNLVWAGKILEGEGHGHSEASGREVTEERRRKGGRKRTGHPPSESWGVVSPGVRSAPSLIPAASVQRTLRSVSPTSTWTAPPTSAGSLFSLQRPRGLSLDAEMLQDLFISHLPLRLDLRLCPPLPATPHRGPGAGAGLSEEGGWRRLIPVSRGHGASADAEIVKWTQDVFPVPPNPPEAQEATEL